MERTTDVERQKKISCTSSVGETMSDDPKTLTLKQGKKATSNAAATTTTTTTTTTT